MAKQLQGTFAEALGFLTSPSTGWVAWTDIRELNRICHLMCGKQSLEEVEDTALSTQIKASFSFIDHTYPLPREFEASWKDWLNAFLARDSETEILLFEKAVEFHAQNPQEREYKVQAQA